MLVYDMATNRIGCKTFLSIWFFFQLMFVGLIEYQRSFKVVCCSWMLRSYVYILMWVYFHFSAFAALTKRASSRSVSVPHNFSLVLFEFSTFTRVRDINTCLLWSSKFDNWSELVTIYIFTEPGYMTYWAIWICERRLLKWINRQLKWKVHALTMPHYLLYTVLSVFFPSICLFFMTDKYRVISASEW